MPNNTTDIGKTDDLGFDALVSCQQLMKTVLVILPLIISKGGIKTLV